MSAIHPAPPGRTGACADAGSRRRRTHARFRMVDRCAILGLSLVLSLLGCTPTNTDSHDVSMPPSSATTSPALVTAAPLETATAFQTLPVYWLGRSGDDVFLYREFFPTKTTDDPLVAALRAMMGAKPKDPDYFTIWNSPTRLGASISAKNVITVDISADAFGQKVDNGIAERAVAQLVYTATAAAAMSGLVDSGSTIQVSILVDGHTGYKAFGQVPLENPLTRNPALVGPVWIIDPAENAIYKTLPLKVAGQGVSPTGTLAWELAKVSNDMVDGVHLNGTVNIAGGPNELGKFSFSLVPPAGTYQLSVYIDDPQSPGRQLGLDTKIVRIAEQNIK